MPMGNVAGPAAAVMGTIVTHGGAAMGAVIDRAYDGTTTPVAMAAAILCIVAFACYRWADVSWDDLAERQLVPLAGMAPPVSAIPEEPQSPPWLHGEPVPEVAEPANLTRSLNDLALRTRLRRWPMPDRA